MIDLRKNADALQHLSLKRIVKDHISFVQYNCRNGALLSNQFLHITLGENTSDKLGVMCQGNEYSVYRFWSTNNHTGIYITSDFSRFGNREMGLDIWNQFMKDRIQLICELFSW